MVGNAVFQTLNNVPEPENEDGVVNLGSMIRKIHSEIEFTTSWKHRNILDLMMKIKWFRISK